MTMKNPPHVGGVVRREVIEPLGLTVSEAAKVLGIGRQALSSLLNEKAALTSGPPSRKGFRAEDGTPHADAACLRFGSSP